MEIRDESSVIALLSGFEADLIRILRLYDFGEFTIVKTVESDTDGKVKRIRIMKQDGNPVRVIMEMSVKMNPSNGTKLNNAIIANGEASILESGIKSLVNKVKNSSYGPEC